MIVTLSGPIGRLRLSVLANERIIQMFLTNERHRYRQPTKAPSQLFIGERPQGKKVLHSNCIKEYFIHIHSFSISPVLYQKFFTRSPELSKSIWNSWWSTPSPSLGFVRKQGRMAIVTGESLIPAKIYLDKIIGFAASLLPAPHLLNILLCVSGLKRPDLFTFETSWS